MSTSSRPCARASGFLLKDTKWEVRDRAQLVIAAYDAGLVKPA